MSLLRNLGRRKTLEQIQAEVGSSGFKRALGPVQLVFLGVGCIIGAGIFVMTGSAAANYAGPAVMLSFVIAGLACAFAGLCYAELASALPVSGSAYTYAYTALGEGAAWTTGWLLLLEYGICAATVAVGFSGYLVNLCNDFGIQIPAALSTPMVNAVAVGEGYELHMGGGFNLIAAVAMVVATAILIGGISLTAAINTAMVVLKVGVLVAFVVIGAGWIDLANWTPFIPENEGGFSYGAPGVLRAASIIFFAYIGFETVSTAAAEARNPQRDMPIGLIGAMVVCTVIYIAVAAVMTGVVPYRMLDVPDPIAVAVDAMGLPWFALFVKAAAVIGLGSVLIGTVYGQTRVFYSMSRDGLLPPLFSTMHPRLQTPWVGTLALGIGLALVAALLPIDVLGDLVTLGTALAFCIVCLSVIWLRNTQPQLQRPYRVPLGGVRIGGFWIGTVPVLGIVLSLCMVFPLLLDIGYKFSHGNPVPVVIIGVYFLIGAVVYLAYSGRNSKLARSQGEAPRP